VKTYTVHLSQVVSIAVRVEAEDEEAAIELGFEKTPAGICANCSGWGQSWSRDDSGEVEFDCVIENQSGEIVSDSKELWRRVRSDAS
jgi:hypothetical protein